MTDKIKLKLKIQIVSDLHIETFSSTYCDPFTFITPSADILILAGDIGSLYKIEQLHNFLSTLSPFFNQMLYVPGNWEFYKLHEAEALSIHILIDRLYNLQKSIPNLIVLNKQNVIIGDICIAGCTLWSDLQIQLPKFIVRIPEMTTFNYKQLHQNHLEYIKTMTETCQKNNLKLIVVSHHCPSYICLQGCSRRDKYISLYASETNLLYSQYVHTWICGHSHNNFDFISPGGTRVVSNQKGKSKDRIRNFSKNFVIEI
jgi:predicted phosphohydrolase